MNINMRYFFVIDFYSKTYSSIEAASDKIWKFERYKLVYEYFHKPILPPPLVLFYYVYLLFKWLARLVIEQTFKESENKMVLYMKKKTKIYKAGFCKFLIIKNTNRYTIGPLISCY